MRCTQMLLVCDPQSSIHNIQHAIHTIKLIFLPPAPPPPAPLPPAGPPARSMADNIHAIISGEGGPPPVFEWVMLGLSALMCVVGALFVSYSIK